MRRLTLFQVFELYLWPRDQDGKLIFEDGSSPADNASDPRANFWRVLRDKKHPDWFIQEKWDTFLIRHGQQPTASEKPQ